MTHTHMTHTHMTHTHMTHTHMTHTPTQDATPYKCIHSRRDVVKYVVKCVVCSKHTHLHRMQHHTNAYIQLRHIHTAYIHTHTHTANSHTTPYTCKRPAVRARTHTHTLSLSHAHTHSAYGIFDALPPHRSRRSRYTHNFQVPS